MNMTFTRSVVLCSFVLLGLGMLSNCAPPQNARTQVTLAASRNLWSTVPIIAEKEGYFEEEGLDVTIEYVQAARFAMDAVVSGSSDFGTVVDINVAFLGFTENQDFQLISTIVRSHDSAIIARRDRGINSPSDLAGRRLGVLSATTSQVYADRFLAANNVSSSQVQVQNLQPVAMQTALVQGGIDAASVWQPFVYNISQALGADNVVVFREPSIYTGYMSIAARRSWLDENGRTTEAFMRALRRALEFVENNPADAQRIVAMEINLDLPIVQAIWDEYDFSVDLADTDLRALVASEGQWITRTQPEFRTRTVPDYAPYFTTP